MHKETSAVPVGNQEDDCSSFGMRFGYYAALRNRNAGEPVADYIVHLGQLAKDCDFKVSLNDMLQDRLVCGVNDDRIQLKLLAEKDANLWESMDIQWNGSGIKEC